MTKKKLVSKAAEILRQNNVRKSVPTQKSILHVSDDDGNVRDFTIKKPGRGVLFNVDDVSAVLDACLVAIEDSLKNGEDVTLHGFGSFNLKYIEERIATIPSTGEKRDIGSHYVPRFAFGKKLRMAVKVYNMLNGENVPDDEADDEVDEDGEE